MSLLNKHQPITGVTSSKMEEIQKRLQTKEAQKARSLLATAMSNYEALLTVRAQIESSIDNDNSK